MAVSNLAIRVFPETVRTLGNAAILAGYSAIGTAFLNPVHLLLIQNLTNQTVMFSWDGVNDHYPVAATSGIVLDITTNKTTTGGSFMIAKGTIIYAKRGPDGASTTGSVYVTVFTGQGA